MKFLRFETYRKNNFPPYFSREQVEEHLRSKGFCKTVQETEFLAINTPQERAEQAIFDFEDLETFLAVKEVVYLCIAQTKSKRAKIAVFYK